MTPPLVCSLIPSSLVPASLVCFTALWHWTLSLDHAPCTLFLSLTAPSPSLASHTGVPLRPLPLPHCAPQDTAGAKASPVSHLVEQLLEVTAHCKAPVRVYGLHLCSSTPAHYDALTQRPLPFTVSAFVAHGGGAAHSAVPLLLYLVQLAVGETGVRGDRGGPQRPGTAPQVRAATPPVAEPSPRPGPGRTPSDAARARARTRR